MVLFWRIRFDALEFLGKMRRKRMMLVGDSIMRNQWESLVCLIEHVIPPEKKTVSYNGSSMAFHALVRFFCVKQTHKCEVFYYYSYYHQSLVPIILEIELIFSIQIHLEPNLGIRKSLF